MKKKCIKQCSLNEDNICTGCKRSISEIVEAGKLNKEKRKDYAKDRKKDCIL
jgi:predicted Fe-S protein YdhL (DUF1289 family)